MLLEENAYLNFFLKQLTHVKSKKQHKALGKAEGVGCYFAIGASMNCGAGSSRETSSFHLIQDLSIYVQSVSVLEFLNAVLTPSLLTSQIGF